MHVCNSSKSDPLRKQWCCTDVFVCLVADENVSSPLAYDMTPTSKLDTPASSILRATPLQSRPDIGNTPNVRQVNLAAASEAGEVCTSLQFFLQLGCILVFNECSSFSKDFFYWWMIVLLGKFACWLQ